MERMLAPLESFLLNFSKRHDSKGNIRLNKDSNKNNEEFPSCLNDSSRTLHDLKSKLADIVGQTNKYGE